MTNQDIELAKVLDDAKKAVAATLKNDQSTLTPYLRSYGKPDQDKAAGASPNGAPEAKPVAQGKPSLIVGTWTESANGVTIRLAVTAGGAFTEDMNSSQTGQIISHGNWRIDGDDLALTFNDGPGAGIKSHLHIAQLDNDKMVLQYEGNSVYYQRVSR